MKKDIFVGTEFYREKGFTKTITVHLTPAMHDELYDLARLKRLSIQRMLRELIARAVAQGRK